jgi:hypothetical protein
MFTYCLLNLDGTPAEQPTFAMRVTARFAYATAVPATRAGAGGFPFAVLQDTA